MIKLCLNLTAAIVITSSSASAQGVAPSWVLPSINGTNINSTNFTGKVIVLNFWATWCAPCIAEMPALIALQQKYAPDGMTVIGMSTDDSTDGTNPPTALVSSFAAGLGLNYPVVMDQPSGVLQSLYGGIGPIPSTFIIDRRNNIVQSFVGEQDYSTFESAVVPLIYTNLTVKLSTAHRLAHISWPVTQATFVVESTANLASGVWTLENAPVQSNGTNQFMDVPVGPTQQFFRLQFQ